MKPKDVLPDAVDAVEKDGVVVRKGTIGAFTENIRIIESASEKDPKYKEAEEDLLELVPALCKLGFFDFYYVKSRRVRKLLREKFPEIQTD